VTLVVLRSAYEVRVLEVLLKCSVVMSLGCVFGDC